MKGIPLMIRNLLTDLYYFVLITVYWIFAALVLLPLKYLDRCFRTNVFGFLDKQIRNLSRAM